MRGSAPPVEELGLAIIVGAVSGFMFIVNDATYCSSAAFSRSSSSIARNDLARIPISSFDSTGRSGASRLPTRTSALAAPERDGGADELVGRRAQRKQVREVGLARDLERQRPDRLALAHDLLDEPGRPLDGAHRAGADGAHR